MRRHTFSVNVGGVSIGSEFPVRLQSMTNTSTLDTDASAAQIIELAGAGAELVRLTAQGIAHAANLAEIKSRVRSRGCTVPLVADVHFNSEVAFEAARHVEKVRINPGNFVDPARKFVQQEWTDEEYEQALEKIKNRLVPFIKLCRDNKVAVRVGVNHGSLSDRVMNRYGAGTEGMVESALEYLRIFKNENFKDVVVSLKASDVPTMTHTVRALAAAMDAEGLCYPLHLGVTEAGNALEARVKSAIGIGSLLAEGLGDTIRVSLSEDPCAEIPVARQIVDHVNKIEPFTPTEWPAKVEAPEIKPLQKSDSVLLLHSGSAIKNGLAAESRANILWIPTSGATDEQIVIEAAIELGYLILAGKVKTFWLDIPEWDATRIETLCRTIVQAAGLTRFKAEIVACPGCGRTLFSLAEALDDVKNACGHLKHLKIAVMGCIVNGPGEMAGADYGYVGAGAGNVSIYRGIEPVVRNIPQAQAVGKLVEIIKADGNWSDPE